MADVREKILAAAARVYAESGFRGTTTRRIAEMAGVSEITLFRHFGSKDALISAALQQFRHHARPLVTLREPQHPAEELQAWAWQLYQHWYAARHLICRVMGDLVEHPQIAPAICEEPSCEHAMVTRYLARMRELGLASPDFVPEAAAGLLLGAVFTHAVWRDHFAPVASDLPPPEQVIGSYVQLTLRSIGAGGTLGGKEAQAG
ncbi:MAG TPA: TetR/AcrR family transcriptional regulator [Gemmatimonadales bacterium]|jgi:AcrR family transcriptional regulator|nr:TetR/AcrR family transcriptional regulator [Gemmatimonadales bacterium]